MKLRTLALLGLVFATSITLGACDSEPEKLGTRASGPGQNTKANSLSVSVASDQVLAEQPKGATAVTVITKSDSTDTSALCTRGLYIGNDAGAVSNVAVIGLGQDAGVTIFQVSAGAFLPVAAAKVMSTGTTAQSITCLAN